MCTLSARVCQLCMCVEWEEKEADRDGTSYQDISLYIYTNL